MLMSARCFEAVGLGYLGVDIVLDRDLGPLILELNARPGLNIQIANRCGLRRRLEVVDQHLANAKDPLDAKDRAVWSSRQFSGSV